MNILLKNQLEKNSMFAQDAVKFTVKKNRRIQIKSRKNRFN